MRGLHYDIIFGLVIIIIIIIIVVIIAINPSILFGKTTKTNLSFRDKCVLWSLNGYNIDSTGGFDYQKQHYDMTIPCSTALGLIFMNPSDWDKCRNLCKGAV